MILYQLTRAKELQFSCELNQILNISGGKGLGKVIKDNHMLIGFDDFIHNILSRHINAKINWNNIKRVH